jgi:hypothetical protein
VVEVSEMKSSAKVRHVETSAHSEACLARATLSHLCHNYVTARSTMTTVFRIPHIYYLFTRAVQRYVGSRKVSPAYKLGYFLHK